MASKEEKILAARRKLKEYQGKARSVNEYSKENSPADPDLIKGADNDMPRSDSPYDPSRMAWERRKTLPVNETCLTNQQASRPSSATSDKNVMIPKVHDNEAEMILLREQIARQTQAINLLVSERSNAETTLSKVQSELHKKSDELEELKSKYKETAQHLVDLENAPRQNAYSMHNSLVEEELKCSLESANQTISALQEQLCELKYRLNVKTAEGDQLTARLKNLENALSIADVKIQQLTIDDNSASQTRENELQEENDTLVRKVELLERRLQAAAMEGEQSVHRFQMYADQCNAQQELLRNQLRDLSQENQKLKVDLTQLQYELSESKTTQNNLKLTETPIDNSHNLIEECKSLREQLQAKESEVESVRGELNECFESLSNATCELEKSQIALKRLEASAVSGRADPALLAAMESDKVAASRAVAQNQNLKEQLTELQQAFVRLSDEKLALTEKVSCAEHECSELRKQLDQEKHIHHEHEHDSGSIEDEGEWDIDMYRRVVATLRKDKAELALRYQSLQNGKSTSHYDSSTHNHDHRHAHAHSHFHHNADDCSHEDHPTEDKPSDEKLLIEVSELRRNVKQLQLDKAELLKRLGGQAEDPKFQGLLETKLKRTMDEIAALDEEKQRLEHLVLQLQGETETIGEYIALYHKQRLLLKQRAFEKDEQLEQLTKDREELKEKLLSLNELVAKLVGTESNPEGESDLKEEVTAQKIKELITEIGNNNVVNSHTIAFEQCSCCSGRLITV